MIEIMKAEENVKRIINKFKWSLSNFHFAIIILAENFFGFILNFIFINK